jgi:hypothetical protein
LAIWQTKFRPLNLTLTSFNPTRFTSTENAIYLLIHFDIVHNASCEKPKLHYTLQLHASGNDNMDAA